MSSSPGASTSLPSIPSSSTASAIASRSPAPKTIGATLRSWRPPLPPTSRPSGGLNPSIPSSWSCGSSLASKTTCRRSRLTNRLREQLHRYYPQLLHLVPAADEPWLWTLLERAPTPSIAQHLPRATVRTILSRHRIRRVDTDAVLATLRAPALPVAPGTVQAAQRHLAVLLPRLRLIHQQRAECATQIEGLLERLGESQEHRDVPILRSVVGVGRVVAATMLAEASRLLAARDYHGLRAQTGVAPITRQSGRRTLVCMRYACNPRLRQAAYHWGQSAARHDPVSRAHYERLRARGHSHARAVRGVVDRLLHVLIAMLTAGTLY